MGNFLGIVSDVGKSIGTADTMQRQGKVLKNAATGAAKGVGNFFKKGISNPFKDVTVGNSAKKFVSGFSNGLRGPRRETVYQTDLFGRTTRQTRYRERAPTSLAGVVGSITAHEYLRNKKKKINRTNSNKKGSFFNRFRKKTGVKSEEQQPPQQNNISIKTKPNSRIKNNSQQSSLPPKNGNNNFSKKKTSLQPPSETINPVSNIENSSQQLPPPLKKVNNNSSEKKPNITTININK
jgi:hypothetical protein